MGISPKSRRFNPARGDHVRYRDRNATWNGVAWQPARDVPPITTEPEPAEDRRRHGWVKTYIDERCRCEDCCGAFQKMRQGPGP